MSYPRTAGTRRVCKMDFCPKCGTRLNSPKKTGRQKVTRLLSCRKCGYKKRATRSMATVLQALRDSPLEGLAVLGKREQKLRTFPTLRRECARCGNNLAYVWMVQVRGLDESSTQFFRCTKCNYTFRENS